MFPGILVPLFCPLDSFIVPLCPFVSTCIHVCPIVPHMHCYNKLSSLNSKLERYFQVQEQIIPLFTFLCFPSILWKFRLSSDHHQQLHLPRKPRTSLTGFLRFVLAGHKGRFICISWSQGKVCISWSQGKVDKGSRGREETRLSSTTLLAATAGVC